MDGENFNLADESVRLRYADQDEYLKARDLVFVDSVRYARQCRSACVRLSLKESDPGKKRRLERLAVWYDSQIPEGDASRWYPFTEKGS